MLKKSLSILIAAVLILALFVGCDKTSSDPDNTDSSIDMNKETIKIGGVRSQSGVFAVFDETAFGPIYRMWVDDVNADGGIYVKEYDKKLPIELIIYDDKSELGTMTRLYEKLILEDEVDFLLPPVSTAFLYAAAPIADKYGYILIGAEGGSTSLKESIAQYPGFFSTLNFSDTQVPALVDLLTEQQVESAYIVFIEDLHGTEYSGAAIPALAQAGIDVAGVKSVPPEIQDMTPILNDAIASEADAFLMFAYPDQNFLAIGQSMALGYNPDLYLIGPGGGFEFINGVFGGPAAVEGLVSWGGWNSKSSPAAADFAERFMAKYADSPEVSVDWWGHLPYYAGLEILQQAIEKVGSLDQTAIRETMATEKFDTVMGQVWFENNMLANECYLGNIGQWQSGIFEVIDTNENRTADPIFPKPAWPAA